MAENNCIFETEFSHTGGRETWIVSHYKRDVGIECVRFTPDEKIIKLDIRLSGTRTGGTRLLWRKIYTGLSPEGNQVITAMSDDLLKFMVSQIMPNDISMLK